MTDQYAEEKRLAFSFDLKEESEDERLTERGREFQTTGPLVKSHQSLSPDSNTAVKHHSRLSSVHYHPSVDC